MNEIAGKKHWTIQQGVLGFETHHGFAVPSTEEIFSAVFEGNYCSNVDGTDVDTLSNFLEFSRYPVDVKIVIVTREDFSISVEFRVISGGGSNLVLLNLNTTGHVVIDSTWYPLYPNSIDEVSLILNSAGITNPGKINFRQFLYLIKNWKEHIQNEVNTESFKSAQFSLQETPANIVGTLYPYQIKGWQWLRYLKQEKIGGILADEMGLGKTLQIISLITADKDSLPSLIICPTTLLENWRREFAKFAPLIKTCIHQGASRTGFPKELKRNDVIITSYDTLVRDYSLFAQIEWSIVICDEAQAIKNPNTKRASSVKRVPRQTGLAVTGTPIENRLTDLWSIMDFALPGYLGDRSWFESTFENSEEGPSQLEKLISPLILRRLVADVAKDLPSRIIIPQVLELSPSEISLYEQIREETEKEFESNASLVVLMRLRLFCTHPFLIAGISDDDPAEHSNKYARLVELMEEIVANGAKAIVFTSFNRMNDILVTDLGGRFNIHAASIDGRTPVTGRQNIVDTFSAIKGAAVLVLNPIAAGAGLNITAANHVIHYNLEWNPAKEDQASARAYRRGQDRPVTIHRLFYADTVEEAIDERLARKREIAGTAIVGVQGEETDYADLVNAIQKSPKHKK